MLCRVPCVLLCPPVCLVQCAVAALLNPPRMHTPARAQATAAHGQPEERDGGLRAGPGPPAGLWLGMVVFKVGTGLPLLPQEWGGTSGVGKPRSLRDMRHTIPSNTVMPTSQGAAWCATLPHSGSQA